MLSQTVVLGFTASLIAGLGTAVGAFLLFFIRDLSDRLEDALISSAAGIMLAATFFSLLLPGIEYGSQAGGSAAAGALWVSLGVMGGAVGLWAIHHYSPHEHFIGGRQGPAAPRLKQMWLFVIAITLHNFPEGMAVGAGFAGNNVLNGISMATGIGLQNMPEGLAVAASLRAVEYSRMQAFGIASLTGLVEPLGGLVGSLMVGISAALMPVTLGIAAGAMLFVISDEIIPETHRRGYETLATFSLLSGFVAMMVLSTVLA
jgi:ZIP family zinc transporter